jgi:hypothetical protein
MSLEKFVAGEDYIICVKKILLSEERITCL